MITIIPLDMSPAAFGSQRWDAETPNMKYPNSVLVFSRENTKKITLQVRTQGRIINVWLSDQEATKLADALELRGVKKKEHP